MAYDDGRVGCLGTGQTILRQNSSEGRCIDILLYNLHEVAGWRCHAPEGPVEGSTWSHGAAKAWFLRICWWFVVTVSVGDLLATL